MLLLPVRVQDMPDAPNSRSHLAMRPGQGIENLLRVLDGMALLGRNHPCRNLKALSDEFQTHMAFNRRMKPHCSNENRRREAKQQQDPGS